MSNLIFMGRCPTHTGTPDGWGMYNEGVEPSQGDVVRCCKCKARIVMDENIEVEDDV